MQNYLLHSGQRNIPKVLAGSVQVLFIPYATSEYPPFMHTFLLLSFLYGSMLSEAKVKYYQHIYLENVRQQTLM